MFLEYFPLIAKSTSSKIDTNQKCFSFSILSKLECHNLSLGLATKARACKGTGQVRIPRLTFHALGNARKCEGMNLHTPK